MFFANFPVWRKADEIFCEVAEVANLQLFIFSSPADSTLKYRTTDVFILLIKLTHVLAYIGDSFSCC